MYLLSRSGRDALLTCLRNLAPQVLLLSMGLIHLVRWRTSHSSLDAALALSIFFILCIAIVASLDEFLEKAFSQFPQAATNLNLVKREPSVAKRIWQVIRLLGKENPIVLIELVFAFLVIYMAMTAVLHSAAQAATKIIR